MPSGSASTHLRISAIILTALEILMRRSSCCVPVLFFALACGSKDGTGSDNHAPIAADLQLVVLKDSSATGRLTASDPDGDPLEYALLGSTTLGELVLVSESTGDLSFTPRPGVVGEESIEFRASDGELDSNAAHLRLRVVEDEPIADDFSFALDEDTPAPITLQGLDPRGNAVDFVIVDRPSHGSLRDVDPSGDGIFELAPERNYFGRDGFTYYAHARGESRRRSRTASVAVTIRPLNDPPLVREVSLRGDEDLPVTATLTATDPEGDSLTYALDRPPDEGQATISSSGALVFTPPRDQAGTFVFRWRATDPSGASATSSVSVRIRATNDPPEISDLSLSTVEGTPVAGRLSFRDPDGDAAHVEVAGSGTLGRLEVVDPSRGTVIYYPRAGQIGGDAIPVAVTDDRSAPVMATVRVTIGARSGPIIAPGLPDPSFNGSGILSLALSPELGVAFGTRVETSANGEVLALGITDTGLRAHVTALARSAAGAPAPAFGGDGILLSERYLVAGVYFATGVDFMGRVLVAVLESRAFSDRHDVLVSRHLPDGALDPSFGAGGLMALPLGAAEQNLFLTVDSQGRATVAVSTPENRNLSSVRVVRLTADGRTDPLFGDGSLDPAYGFEVDQAVTTRAMNQVRGLVVDDTDRVVAVLEASSRTVVLRLDGSTAEAIATFPDLHRPWSARRDGAGRLYIEGYEAVGDALMIHVDLGGQGAVTLNTTQLCGATRSSNRFFAVDGAAQVLLGWQDSTDQVRLCRLDAMGVREPAYSSTASIAVAALLGPEGFVLRGLDTDATGRAYLSGSVERSAGDPHTDWAVARLDPAGRTDRTWSTGGLLRVSLGSGNDVGFDAAIDRQGRLVALAKYEDSTLFASERGLSLVRFNASGALDPAFNAGRRRDLPAGTLATFGASLLAVDSQNRPVVAARHDNNASVYRFTAAGALDTSFNGTGAGAGDFSPPKALAIDRQDRILIGLDASLTVIRYTAAGDRDTTFGTGTSGTVLLDPVAGGTPRLEDLVVDASDRVVGLVRRAVSPTAHELRLYRLLSSGAADPSFGGGSPVTHAVPPIPDWARARVAIDRQGRLIASVLVETASTAVVRFTPSGQLDSTFGSGGAVTLQTTVLASPGLGIDRQDRITLSQLTSKGGGAVRLLPDGRLDPSFGLGGEAALLRRDSSGSLRVGTLITGDAILALALDPASGSSALIGTLDGELWIAKLLP
ncbi:MAG: tandem-95 repeat protein [Deltaproteobacteria bacterium]|nr:tandem-95 repeat protein [Deltaproteobacteria bacterium]